MPTGNGCRHSNIMLSMFLMTGLCNMIPKTNVTRCFFVDLYCIGGSERGDIRDFMEAGNGEEKLYGPCLSF
jgi:hypothetical protein